MADELIQTFIDRSDWAPGPWDDEPDRVEWRDDATGLPCLVRRGNAGLGVWCGYVALPPGHPWHGLGYDDLPVEVHGGLTFCGPCDEDEGEDRICHVPQPGESDNVWWLGFDCGHGMDLKPGMAAYEARLRGAELDEHVYGAVHTLVGEVYRNIDYARTQCELLAHQAAVIARLD